MPRPRRASTEQAAEALSRVAPLATRLVERLLAGHDPPLSVSQYVALLSIEEGGLAGAELARRAAVSPAAVSQLLAGLEREGLLERSPSAVDRRRHALTLGPRGRTVLRSARGMLTKRLAELLGELPPHEADAVVRSLELLQSRLSGTAPPPRPRKPPKPPPPPHRRR
jgi:DNA-binding MarR family transcriptional regulator